MPTVSFPVQVLPTTLQPFVREQARALGTAPDFLGVSVLVVAGTTLGNAWSIPGDNAVRVRASLFAALVGRAGCGKSEAMRTVLAPLVAEQMSILQKMHDLDPQHILGPGRVAEINSFDCLLAQGLRSELLRRSNRGYLVVVENLADLLRQTRAARERAEFVAAWTGGGAFVDPQRVEQQHADLRPPVVGLLGELRPFVLRKLKVEETALAERMLFAFPDWVALPRCPEVDRTVTQAVWEKTVQRLLEERRRKRYLRTRFDPGGRKLCETWLTGQGEDVPEALAGTWTRLKEYVPRLALILQALRWACGETGQKVVEDASVEAAVELGRYFQAQMERVHGLTSGSHRQRIAERIVQWLTAHPECQRFRRRDLYRHMCRQLEKPEDLDAPLRLLEELGCLRRDKVSARNWTIVEWIVEEREDRETMNQERRLSTIVNDCQRSVSAVATT